MFPSNSQWLKTTSFVSYNQSESSQPIDDIIETRVEIKALRVNKYSSVYVGGICPLLIIKDTASLPISLDLRGLGLLGMTSFHTPKCERGLMCLTRKVSQLP